MAPRNFKDFLKVSWKRPYKNPPKETILLFKGAMRCFFYFEYFKNTYVYTESLKIRHLSIIWIPPYTKKLYCLIPPRTLSFIQCIEHSANWRENLKNINIFLRVWFSWNKLPLEVFFTRDFTDFGVPADIRGNPLLRWKHSPVYNH